MTRQRPGSEGTRRAPLVAIALVALLAAMWGGLVRMGWRLPAIQPMLPADHGALMIAGFLGTLIGLERAVALGRPWAYAGPLLTGAGGLLLAAGLGPAAAGPVLITVGSVVLVAIFILVLRLQAEIFNAVIGLGAVLWLAGNVLWLSGWGIPRVVPWWMGFLVLTVVGERLELSRLARSTPMRQSAFFAAAGVFLAGIVVTAFAFEGGWRLMGLGMVALAFWLLRYDLARRTIRQRGLTRFIAACLLSGYVWLGIGGLLALFLAGPAAGPIYDAILHAVFLGFIFALIFGHAPIIFPAILRRPIDYRPAFYTHLVVLQLSLVLRVAGDLAGWFVGRQWGGMLNVVAVLLFLAGTVYALAPRTRKSPPAGRVNVELMRPCALALRDSDAARARRPWGSSSRGRLCRLGATCVSSRHLPHSHAPNLRSLLEVVPRELPGPFGLELIVERLGVVVIDQNERLARVKRLECAEDE